MSVRDKKQKFDTLRKVIGLGDIALFTSSLLGLIVIYIEFYEISKVIGMYSQINNRIYIYNIIICAVMVFVNIHYIMYLRREIKTRISLLKLEEKHRNLLEVTDSMRCFKHDFNNIIQAIDGYICLQDMNSLQIYFEKLLSECNYINEIEILSEKQITNPAIFGILLNKYKMAREKDIQMNIDVLACLGKYNEKSYVVSRILGILLDNALEATNGCEEKIINVKFLKEEDKQREVIIIENTYMNKDVDTNKIFEKNYTTKDGNTGLGLWKISDILSKDTSLNLYTTKDDIMFKQQLEIYN